MKGTSASTCSLCLGTGWERVVAGNVSVRICRCQKTILTEKRIERARIPMRFEKASFDNFKAYNVSLVKAFNQSKAFVESWPLVDSGLLYLGSVGTGKSHLAASVLRAVIEKGDSGLFYDVTELMKLLQSSYNPATNTSEIEILNPVFETPLLVLDEIGMTRPTEWVLETLQLIISKRYNELRPVILTTNYLDAPGTGLLSTETLSERIGARFRSRLLEMCREITVEGDDYRELIKNRRAPRITNLQEVNDASR